MIIRELTRQASLDLLTRIRLGRLACARVVRRKRIEGTPRREVGTGRRLGMKVSLDDDCEGVR